MFISVVIPVYNDWDRLICVLDSFSNQSLAKDYWEVVVVDNNSDYTADLPAYSFQFRIVCCTKPGSYAARNTGIGVSKGELLVFTDADCRPSETWLEEYYNLYSNQEWRGICAGAVVVKKFEPGPANVYEKYDMMVGIPQKHYAIDKGYGVTANLAIPRSILETVGNFDSSRFSGGDAEFCLRAKKSGYNIVYNSAAMVAHPARSTWSELEVKARRVKGGQIKSGPTKRRIFYMIASFIMPIKMLNKVFTTDADFISKLQASRLVVRLFIVEVIEIGRLLLGREAERR